MKISVERAADTSYLLYINHDINTLLIVYSSSLVIVHQQFLQETSLPVTAASATLRISEYWTSELHPTVNQKSIPGENRSVHMQNFKNRGEKEIFKELVGLPACVSASLLLILMRISTRSLVKVELARRTSIENMDIDTFSEICKFRETSKVSSRNPQIITRSDGTDSEHNTL